MDEKNPLEELEGRDWVTFVMGVLAVGGLLIAFTGVGIVLVFG